jgi:hypothetical protein
MVTRVPYRAAVADAIWIARRSLGYPELTS